MVTSLHVDDFTIAATPNQFKWLVNSLEKRYAIKYQEATLCLGMKIEKN